jgi:ATP-dependent DNA ligase
LRCKSGGPTLKWAVTLSGIALKMSVPLEFPVAPMEATQVSRIPQGSNWQYEPKWDGFRCLAFRSGDDVQLQSKSSKPLTRYFPEVVAELLKVRARKFVLDGELVVPVRGVLSFDDLLQRIHPAASRVNKLAAEHPATFIVFDLLGTERGSSLLDKPLSFRRPRLERFAERFVDSDLRIDLSPATTDFELASEWYRGAGGGLDGIMAKRLDAPYSPDSRDAMQKIKRLRSADCVVAGFRYATKGKVVGSLLLGLYDDEGLLHHVGFTSGIPAAEREALTARLSKLRGGPGFTGRAPGGPSRWSSERSEEWEPLKPKLVVEVRFDHASGDRFRHGTKLLRWRPDKSPKQCTMDQLDPGRPPASLKLA